MARPVLPADILGGLHDLDVPLLGEGLDEVVVIGGDGPEVGGVTRSARRFSLRKPTTQVGFCM